MHRVNNEMRAFGRGQRTHCFNEVGRALVGVGSCTRLHDSQNKCHGLPTGSARGLGGGLRLRAPSAHGAGPGGFGEPGRRPDGCGCRCGSRPRPHTHAHKHTHPPQLAAIYAGSPIGRCGCVLRTIEMHAGTPLALVTAFQLLRDGGFSTAGYGGDRMAMDSIRTVLMDFVTNVGPSHHSVLSAPVDSEMPCIMPRDHHAACLITMSCCCER